MGKGFNNYMTKKFFHPSSKDNIKRKWMAEQKTAFEKKQQEELLAQYQKEQEVLSNRALLGDEKAKLGLSFLYDAPPGLKKKEFAIFSFKEPEGQQEVKFEWQRKYNAPREAYAKDDDTIRDQPFGIEVRNVRCIKCRQWGHVNTDKICPLYGKNLTAEPELPSSSGSNLLSGLKAEGFSLKNSVLSRMMESDPDERHAILAQEDEEDPEVQFLKTLTPKQKKKLLKKLNKLQSNSKGGVGKKSKRKKKKSKSNRESDSDSSEGNRKEEKKSSKSLRPRKSASTDSEGNSSPEKDHKSHRVDEHRISQSREFSRGNKTNDSQQRKSRAESPQSHNNRRERKTYQRSSSPSRRDSSRRDNGRKDQRKPQKYSGSESDEEVRRYAGRKADIQRHRRDRSSSRD